VLLSLLLLTAITLADETDVDRPVPIRGAAGPPPPTLDRPCPDQDYLAWAASRKAPSEPPERAQGWDFEATLWHRLAATIEAHPNTVHPSCLGLTVEQRRVWAFTIRGESEPVQKRMLVFAQLHALEWIGAEVAVAFVEEHAAAPPAGVELVVMPVVNRDGRWRTEEDLLEGRTRTYRRANANRVDLNRDYAVNRENHNLWSRLPFTKRYYYASPAPLSQPESRIVDRLAATGFDAAVSLHAFGGYVYFPWAGRYGAPDDQGVHREMAEKMVSDMPGRPYRVNQLARNMSWFRGLGMEIDHIYGTYGTPSFLIELTRSGVRLREPTTWRDYFRWYNPADKTPHVAAGLSLLDTLVREMSAEVQGLGH
jgi:hypothetical protein